MDTIFVKYRKAFIVCCVFLLIYFPYEVHRALTRGDIGTGQLIGSCLNAVVIDLFIPVFILIRINKLYKSSRDVVKP